MSSYIDYHNIIAVFCCKSEGGFVVRIIFSISNKPHRVTCFWIFLCESYSESVTFGFCQSISHVWFNRYNSTLVIFRSEERRVGNVTGVQTCALPILDYHNIIAVFCCKSEGGFVVRIIFSISNKPHRVTCFWIFLCESYSESVTFGFCQSISHVWFNRYNSTLVIF